MREDRTERHTIRPGGRTLTHPILNAPHHTLWYRIKDWIFYPILVGGIVVMVLVARDVAKQRDPGDPDFNAPVTITVASTYRFLPTDRITYKAIKGVGLTY